MNSQPINTLRFKAAWRLVASGISLCVFLNVSAFAQDPANKPNADLQGVELIRVSFSQLTPDATVCGLSLGVIQPLLKNKLMNGGFIAIPETDTLATLGLMTTYDQGRNACGTSATLGVYRKVSYFDESVGWLRTGYVVLWQRGQQVQSGVANHAASTAVVVQQLADTLIQSWQEDNKTTQ